MFFKIIKDLLVAQNKTQAQLAAFVHVKPNTVSEWLNNGSSPKIDKIYLIANFFGVSFDYLFTGEEGRDNQATNISNSAIVQGNHATTLIVRNGEVKERELSEQEIELLRIFNSSNVKKQTTLMSFAFDIEDELK